MSDFALRVKNLPPDSEYGDREDILKAHLWNHFQELLAKEDSGSDADWRSAEKKKVPKSVEVADVTFGKQEIHDTAQLMKLYALNKKIHTL